MTTVDKVRIVIVEDNDVVREGLTLMINHTDKFKVINAYRKAEPAVKNLLEDQPDIVLMDLELPGIHGEEATFKMKGIRPETKIVVNSVRDEPESVFKALCAGAIGYIKKDAQFRKVIEALEEVVKGGAPMSPAIANMVVSSFQKNPVSPLSARETEVLSLLAKGKSYSIIADEIFVHKETVKSHIKSIYQKLQVNSKPEAIEKAIKNRLI